MNQFLRKHFWLAAMVISISAPAANADDLFDDSFFADPAPVDAVKPADAPKPDSAISFSAAPAYAAYPVDSSNTDAAAPADAAKPAEETKTETPAPAPAAEGTNNVPAADVQTPAPSVPELSLAPEPVPTPADPQ